MKLREKYTCPLEVTHDITKGKWKPIILWQLNNQKKCSLSKLQREIAGITEKMLIQQLNELLEYQLVDKKKYAGYPLKVEYSLTERGKKMVEAVVIMQEIGIDILKENDKTDVLEELGLL